MGFGFLLSGETVSIALTCLYSIIVQYREKVSIIIYLVEISIWVQCKKFVISIPPLKFNKHRIQVRMNWNWKAGGITAHFFGQTPHSTWWDLPYQQNRNNGWISKRDILLKINTQPQGPMDVGWIARNASKSLLLDLCSVIHCDFWVNSCWGGFYGTQPQVISKCSLGWRRRKKCERNLTTEGQKNMVQ